MKVNGVAPGIMAEEAKKLNAAMVHYIKKLLCARLSADVSIYLFCSRGAKGWSLELRLTTALRRLALGGFNPDRLAVFGCKVSDER